MRTFLIILALPLLAGCSLLPVDKSRSESVRATEALAVESEKTIQRVLEVSPMQAMPSAAKGEETPVATPMREEVRVTSRTVTGAGSRSSAAGTSITSLSTGMKLILLAAGVLAVWVVFSLIRNKSLAVRAASDAFDSGMASLIGNLETQIRQSTNPEELMRLNAQLAAAEKERGKLHKKGTR